MNKIYFNIYNKKSENILKIMENLKESKFWFTSLMGFFYQIGIKCDLNKDKVLKIYFLSIKNEIENDTFFHFLIKILIN